MSKVKVLEKLLTHLAAIVKEGATIEDIEDNFDEAADLLFSYNYNGYIDTPHFKAYGSMLRRICKMVKDRMYENR